MIGVVELTRQLIAIDSTNPDLIPGGAGEAAVADFAGGWLTERGFECHRLEQRAGRPSIVGVARGSGGGRSIMLNGHLDTVTLAGFDGEPLVATERDGSLFGRGAYDMKSGLAAMMCAAAAVARESHAGDVLVALVADEEYASAGTEEVLTRFRADGAVVAEPSGLDLVVAHRGFVWAEVTIHGRAAHGSRPDLGVDAIAKAGRFLTGLDELQRALASRPPHPLLGTGNIHASLISGGEELSSYPARCTIGLERRTVPGEDAATVERELRAVLDATTEHGYDLAITFERQPFRAGDSAIVADLRAAATAHLGRPPTERGEPFWTDCALLEAAGIPAVLFGVDGGGAHAAVEWVTLDSLHRTTAILTDTIRMFTSSR
ncbi:M20/M25/M40 family metallo-hydrolase [Dactylosporangium sp. AC04546]|uniref:M20/M25/M40 family metallo-hydrolase n=1 Tax=Dactylosporangium sp. AC04546 TaxID=2862460 RepID=UPI001EDEB995|nr:M20/M25/M40 family metallo-hydrolase [Dactylosporangium sp. AC04546]WVK79890.1 M20/M25/M40 family metallo-hydrolase [Dactylosporangium sp. AC04546]